MSINVIFYGWLRERFGSEITIDEHVDTVNELLTVLSDKDMSIVTVKDHLLVSINQQKASFESPVDDGDNIALFLTPSGG